MTTTNGTRNTTRTAPAKGGDPWASGAEPPAQRHPARQARPAEPVAVPGYTLSFREPTGRTSYPLILVEGEEYSLKSTLAVTLAGDPRLGETWMLPVGEEVDWLSAVAPFKIVEHNGQWWQIIGAVEQMHAAAAAIRAAGGKPPLLIVDSASKVWELLATWAEYRARSSDTNRRKLALDPNAEIDISHTYWNAANRRHRRLVHLLRSMPAVVVVTGRGKWVSAFDKGTGRPVPGQREYSVQVQAELPYATTAWVRLSREAHPQIVAARMAQGGIRPGVNPPMTVDPGDPRFAALAETGFNLSWLLDVLDFDPAVTEPARAVEPDADAEPDDAAPQPTGPAILAGASEYPGAPSPEVIHPAEQGGQT